MSDQRIAIVGAGFSGTLLALHLMRQSGPDTRIILIERRGRFGLGTAYSTGNASHLLNVPADKMSAFQNQPEDFLNWLKFAEPEVLAGAKPTPGTFVPRAVFGSYVGHLLGSARSSAVFCGQLDLVHADVHDIETWAEGVTLTLDNGERITARRAVLAVGNFPPSPPPVADPSFYGSDLFTSDPWEEGALSAIDPEAPVLLIGTGLTTVDAVVSLLDRAHRGPVIALSRRGLLPRVHLPVVPPPAMPDTEPCPTRLNALTRHIRAHIRAVETAGGTWRSVIDALRPLTSEIWQAMPVEDRRRFLRHLRPWWDTHRHRMAPAVAARIEEARRTGQFFIKAGRILGYDLDADGSVAVRFRPRFAEHLESVAVRRVINCAGPESDFARVRDPLIRNLLAKGMVRPDPLGLGLDVTLSCAVLNADGATSRRLFAVGPLTKGTFWEMTAVPDIRQQAETLAGCLAPLLRPAVPSVHTADLAWSI